MADINSMYKDPATRLLAAQRALRSTVYGIGRVIRAELDANGLVQFVSNASGSTFSNIKDAMNEAGRMGISTTSSIRMSDIMSGKKNALAGNRIGSLAGMGKSIGEAMKKGSRERALLSQAGISDDFMNEFLKGGSIVVSTTGESDMAMKDIASRVLQDIKSGRQVGIPLIDPKGGRVLNFMAGSESLSYSQANALMSIVGIDPMNFEGFNDLSSGIGGAIGKLGKRLKLFAAERDVSVSGRQLEAFMGKKEAFMFRPREDILGILSGVNNFGADKRSKILNNLYGNFDDIRQDYGHYLDLDNLSDSQKRELKRIYRTGNTADEIINEVGDKLGTDLQEGVRRLFKAIEHDDDGSILINDSNRKGFIKSLQNTLNKLDPVSDADQISDIQREIRALSLGGESVTVGYSYVDNMGSTLTVKGAARFDIFNKALKDVGILYSDVSVKKEAGMLSQGARLVLSGFGEETDRVAADIGTSSFLQDIVVTKENIEAIQQNEQRVLAEIREMADTGVMPKSIKEVLTKAADQDLSLIDDIKGPAARRNKQFAQEIIRLVQSGVNVSQIPQAMSMISKMYASEAYRLKDDLVLPIMPDYQRLALDTEASFGGTTTRGLLSGNTSSIVEIQSSAGNTFEADLFNFRIKGHTLYTGRDSMARLKEALGGADLDDHILRNIVTYNDENGANRLAFYLMRQPSGTEEFLITRASADVETYQAIFGRYGNFVETAEDLLSSTTNAGERTGLENLIKVMNSTVKDTMVDELLQVSGADQGIESAAVRVLNQMGKNLHRIDPTGPLNSGPLVLQGSEIMSDSALYANRALARLKIEESNVSIADEVIEMLDEQGISDSLRNKISQAVSGSDVDLNVLDIGDVEVRGFLEQARQRKVLRTVSEAGGNLGQFVNRTMVLGSFLGQYDQFLNQAGSNVGNFLLDNYKIGLIAQETAIDASIQVADSMRIIGAVNNAAAAGADVSSLLDDFGGAGASLSIDEVGEVVTRKLGSIMGVASLTAEGSGMGISSMLMNRKVSDTDMRLLIQGAISGIEDAMDQGIDLVSNAQDVLDDLRAVEVAQDSDRIREAILRNFTLDSASDYGRHSVDVIDRSLPFANFESVTRSLISRGEDQFMIKAYEDASDEARRVGQLIVDKYADDYSSVMRLTDDMSEQLRFDTVVRRMNIGEQILTDIRLATEVQGVSRSDLFSAITYQFNQHQQRINIGMMDYITGESAQLLDDINNINYIKRTQSTASLRNATTDFVSQYLLNSMDPNQTVDDLTEIAKMELQNLKASMPVGGPSSMEQSILESLAGEAADDMDVYTRQAVEAQTNIVRAQIAEAGFDQDILDDIARLGTATDASGQTGQAADFMQEAINASMQDPDELAELKRTKYKPILRDSATAKSYIGDLLAKPGFKKGLVIAAIASAGSFIYSGSKDVTQQDIQGPPLLPGGSAYEEMPVRTPQLPAIEERMYSQGASYNVSINGSYEDAQRFNEAVGGMDNVNYSTTMYNRIPDLSSNALTRFMEYL